MLERSSACPSCCTLVWTHQQFSLFFSTTYSTWAKNLSKSEICLLSFLAFEQLSCSLSFRENIVDFFCTHNSYLNKTKNPLIRWKEKKRCLFGQTKRLTLHLTNFRHAREDQTSNCQRSVTFGGEKITDGKFSPANGRDRKKF